MSLVQISNTEREELERFGNGVLINIPYECAQEGFEIIAKSEPNRIAVEHYGVQLTYGELNSKSNQVANNLRLRGLNSGFIGIVTMRSVEMIIAILGVLKAGAAYVPIDSEMPVDRIQYILDTANCETILVHPNTPVDTLKLLDRSKAIDITCSYASSDDVKRVSKGTDPAYAVFTSGSTGKPKGVVVSHQALSNFIYPEPNLLHVGPGDRVSQLVSISFDMCVADIFCTLSKKGTLILRENDFFESIRKSTIIHTTPTALSYMEPIDFPTLKTIILGGEPCKKILLDKWCDRVTMYNAYGPTEVTITSAYGELKKTKTITVGKPIPNTKQYIVDRNLQL
ncbi:hypothetical protein HDV02_000771, partial [Globomyces sp. JEL0801]